MSNLDNMNTMCPALMSDGRTSVNTDYKSTNDSFKILIDGYSNSYKFRNALQKNGFTNINQENKYNLCTTVPFGNTIYDKNIKLNYATTGSWMDSFKPLI